MEALRLWGRPISPGGDKPWDLLLLGKQRRAHQKRIVNCKCSHFHPHPISTLFPIFRTLILVHSFHSHSTAPFALRCLDQLTTKMMMRPVFSELKRERSILSVRPLSIRAFCFGPYPELHYILFTTERPQVVESSRQGVLGSPKDRTTTRP